MKQLEWETVQCRVSDLIPQADNYKKISESRKKS